VACFKVMSRHSAVFMPLIMWAQHSVAHLLVITNMTISLQYGMRTGVNNTATENVGSRYTPGERTTVPIG
jgi:hypothetical protein